MPKSTPPLISCGGDINYLRFHGPGGSYRGSYPDDFLNEYALHVISCMENGQDVYVYFNNTMGDAVKNLMTLNSMVSSTYDRATY
jgi:uncharacterized protein YecE (DUF72 family)